MMDLAAHDASHYPLMLDLRGRRAVVIGGGAIAEQKVKELRAAGARTRLVSPALTDGLAALVAAGVVEHVRRPYRRGDLDGARIAIAATDDPAVNQAIWNEAEENGVLLNVVDDVAHCHFIAPSVHRCGDITVAVSTAGRCPTLAVRLRERIASLVRREHADLARLAGALRADVLRRVPSLARRRTLWYRVVDSTAIDALRDGRRDDAEATIESLIRDAERGVDVEAPNDGARVGTVALVGAGPGDPALITVRGRGLLERAEVVVHDRLVSDALLDWAPATARRIPVGKHGHGPSTSQAEIDAILIREARRGRRVVRLKGGDPFVFGRGAEEAEALRRAGVSYEVVPGVSSAVAGPGAAGIPLTHRALASGFAVVTGHECATPGDDDASSRLDWEALARIPTLVVLMGLRALPRIAERLLANGLGPDVPAAVISRATLPDQRVVVGTVATIAELVAEEGLAQPATLIVGDVVSLADASTESLAAVAALA
jgi:uroporphyrin-III C-methyltransferase/precorrin-2 dehydrogenase/sirohydrochlorin ferrochelatase